MVRKNIGIILVETKATDTQASDVYRQLDKAQAKLLELNSEITKCTCAYCRELEVTLNESCFKKVKAIPNTDFNHIKCNHNDSVYFQLGCNHLKSYDSFNGWWLDMMSDSYDIDGTSIYHKIIPKIFMKLLKRSQNLLFHNLEVVGWLETQKYQSQYMKKTNNPEKPYDPDSAILQNVWEHITFEQCSIWEGKKHQVICGPLGSGKTVLIQCKAATLACHDISERSKNVLVIIPNHLKVKYQNFFIEQKCEKN